MFDLFISLWITTWLAKIFDSFLTQWGTLVRSLYSFDFVLILIHYSSMLASERQEPSPRHSAVKIPRLRSNLEFEGKLTFWRYTTWNEWWVRLPRSLAGMLLAWSPMTGSAAWCGPSGYQALTTLCCLTSRSRGSSTRWKEALDWRLESTHYHSPSVATGGCNS